MTEPDVARLRDLGKRYEAATESEPLTHAEVHELVERALDRIAAQQVWIDATKESMRKHGVHSRQQVDRIEALEAAAREAKKYLVEGDQYGAAIALRGVLGDE